MKVKTQPNDITVGEIYSIWDNVVVRAKTLKEDEIYTLECSNNDTLFWDDYEASLTAAFPFTVKGIANAIKYIREEGLLFISNSNINLKKSLESTQYQDYRRLLKRHYGYVNDGRRWLNGKNTRGILIRV